MCKLMAENYHYRGRCGFSVNLTIGKLSGCVTNLSVIFGLLSVGKKC